VDALPFPPAQRRYNLLFTNLDSDITRYLFVEVDRRIPKSTYAQPRWIPSSLLRDANAYVHYVIHRSSLLLCLSQRACVAGR
jgi:hypothetical protein